MFPVTLSGLLLHIEQPYVLTVNPSTTSTRLKIVHDGEVPGVALVAQADRPHA